MGSRLSPRISVFVYGFTVVFFYSAGFLLSSDSSPNLVMSAVIGFLCSMGMVFTIFVVGHIYQIMGIRRKPSLIPVILSSFVSCIFAYLISIYSIPFTICINLPLQIYLYNASNMKTPDSIKFE